MKQAFLKATSVIEHNLIYNEFKIGYLSYLNLYKVMIK